VDMPDAVASRKRQVSRLRSNGSKGAFNKSLYKAPAAVTNPAIRERNSRIIFVRCRSPEILGLLFLR
jgi:hypothetical protein